MINAQPILRIKVADLYLHIGESTHYEIPMLYSHEGALCVALIGFHSYTSLERVEE